MQPNLQKLASDDEDDLESLRLAALQSLKRPSSSNLNAENQNNFLKLFNKKPNKRRFNLGRSNRNGAFNNRIRNTTLITVPTIELEAVKEKVDVTPKLVLPQDRYCNSGAVTVEEKSEISSKFDRYNNSDSDSDSDSNDENSVPSKLQRSSSLEALMQELENEIQGDIKPKEEIEQKPKKIKRVRKSKCEIVEQSFQENNLKTDETVQEDCAKVLVKSPLLKQIHTKQTVENSIPSNISSNIYTNTPVAFQAIPYPSYNTSLCPPVIFETQPSFNYSVAPPLIGVNDLNPHSSSVFSKLDNPLPPLKINTDILNTITAPLSPRSAAFVLQNREIIERRKKSPRRSYSRSPSPRYRRSNSRSLSPMRRLSPKNRRPQSYKRSSPSSGNRYIHTSPKRTRRTPPRVAHTSFEEKPTKSPSISLSPSPDRSILDENKDDGSFDPILEARRRKFENGSIPTEGIIRLRPKNEESDDGIGFSAKDATNEERTDSIHEESIEDELLGGDDAIDFNLKVDDLFSDEESDNENEGRFKSKQSSPRVVSVKPFSQISNGLSKTNMTEPDRSYRNKSYDRERRHRDRREVRKTSRSPNTTREPIKSNKSDKEHDGIKSLMSLKIDNPRRKPIALEAKSERKCVEEVTEEVGIKVKRGSSGRKVEVANVAKECALQEDSDADDDLATINSSCDLRAQLSRKRAERQHMLPKIEKIPSRLLQSALQGAVFKKLKKSKIKEKDLTSIDNVDDVKYAAVKATTNKNGYGDADISYYTANAQRKVRLLHCDYELIPAGSDGKLPIHLRLGIPGSFAVVNEPKAQKKSSGKRSKSRAKLEQVLYLATYYISICFKEQFFYF
ncbi:hypothetical protein FQR65_LT10756 [Abscondita terminalis]|nr:hypothetical protein FQR65_LT10756 [Abscondita terminalis]